MWEEVLTCIVASMSSHAQAWRASACETCCSRGASTAHYRHTSQLPYARIEMCSVKLSVTTSWWWQKYKQMLLELQFAYVMAHRRTSGHRISRQRIRSLPAKCAHLLEGAQVLCLVQFARYEVQDGERQPMQLHGAFERPPLGQCVCESGVNNDMFDHLGQFT